MNNQILSPEELAEIITNYPEILSEIDVILNETPVLVD